MAGTSNSPRPRQGRALIATLALAGTLLASLPQPRALARPADEHQPTAPTASEASKGPPSPAPQQLETVKLDDGTEVQVETWGKTYPAYEYHAPIEITDRDVQVILDGKQDHTLTTPPTALQIDAKRGWLYWSEGWNKPLYTGRVMRARLDGSHIQELATRRLYPRDLVFDSQRDRLYWLEGIKGAPCRLQVATLNGKERTLCPGLNRPLGMAFDANRGHLYFWQDEHRLVRVNVEGAGEEELVTNDTRVAARGFGSLAYDSAHDRLFYAHHENYGWLSRDGTGLQYLPRMLSRFRTTGFAIDENSGRVYFTNYAKSLMRANMDGTQMETLVVSPPREGADGWDRAIAGSVALDMARGHVYWTGARTRGGIYPPIFMICRTTLRQLPRPSERAAPPRIATIEPAEQGPGGEITLSGDGLRETTDVIFIDDSTNEHTRAEFHEEGGRLAVKVPRLTRECRLPVIVAQTPGGLTMTLGTDVVAPSHKPYQYEAVRSLDPSGDPHWLWSNKPYRHERLTAGIGRRLWLQPGQVAGNIECAVVYAQDGSSAQYGPKGRATVFAKNDSYLPISEAPGDGIVIYHEPFAYLMFRSRYVPGPRWIAVPAIRPSFPARSFHYRHD